MPDDDFTIEEMLDGYDPSMAQERYDNHHTATAVKHTAGRLLGKPKKDVVPLKKLMPRHYEMIALHLKGRKLSEIAEAMHCTYATAWRVINDPESKTIIEEFYTAHKVDLMGLFPLAVDAVRKGLNSTDIKTGLLAVDRFTKLRESVNDENRDVTQVNITIVNDARLKLVGAIKKKAPTMLTENSDGSFSPAQ